MKQRMDHVREFFAKKRVALVGVSRKEKSYGRMLFDELLKRDYEVQLVHQEASSIDGRVTFYSLSMIDPPPQAAMILLTGEKAQQPLVEALAAGIRHIWLYGITGPKDLNPEVRRMASESGAKVVMGFCPFMFLPEAGLGHRLHGWLWKRLGMYPVEPEARREMIAD